MTRENRNISDLVGSAKGKASDRPGGAPARNSAGMSRTDNMVGYQLRRLFRDVVDEPIPGEMEDLLRQLDDKTS